MNGPTSSDFTEAVRAESERFLAAARQATDLGTTALGTAVPACPDWTLDDLVWHLSEVQHFWGAIVGQGLPGPQAYDRPARPPSAELIGRFAEWSADLSEVLTGADPDQPCWSWHPAGHHIGWVQRRQAHEALVHRIDAEQTLAAAGGPQPTPVDPALALDGVDEILRGMLDVGDVPAWGTWSADGSTVAVVASAGSGGVTRSWHVALGRVVGVDRSGVDQDLEALQVLDVSDRDGVGPADVEIRGPADRVDLWLWGRATDDELAVTGDATVAQRLRSCAMVH